MACYWDQRRGLLVKLPRLLPLETMMWAAQIHTDTGLATVTRVFQKVAVVSQQN